MRRPPPLLNTWPWPTHQPAACLSFSPLPPCLCCLQLLTSTSNLQWEHRRTSSLNVLIVCTVQQRPSQILWPLRNISRPFLSIPFSRSGSSTKAQVPSLASLMDDQGLAPSKLTYLKGG